ncbi:MAG: peptidylprolyl isomerase [Planctomycetota bacterium]|nr:peptidylprolyl isomerase [Planctomycetota bacterium]MEC9047863.1 peptidylprolyl isomerase [Planctomycetota bacterium]
MTDVISSGQRVSLQYRLTLDDGTVVEDAMKAEPLVYVHGTGQMVPGLEKQLEGKRVGEECRLEVEAADAYGEYDPAAEQAVPRSQFPADADIRPGVSFQAKGPRGVVDVRVLKLNGDDVVITTNHPLAGHRLTFDVRVVDVRKATAEASKKADSG